MRKRHSVCTSIENESYYDLLRHSSLKMWLKEEKTCKEQFGFKKMSASTEKSLIARYRQKRESGRARRNKFTGVWNYDILMDKEMQNRFSYIPTHVYNRAYYVPFNFDQERKERALSFPRLVCDLAYLSPNQRLKQLNLT